MRVALVLTDETIANIAAVDPGNEDYQGFVARMDAAGVSLVPLDDEAATMDGESVEPGDICTSVVVPTFVKGTPGTVPIGGT